MTSQEKTPLPPVLFAKSSSSPYLSAFPRKWDLKGLEEADRSRERERQLQSPWLVLWDLSLSLSQLMKPNKEDPSFCIKGPQARVWNLRLRILTRVLNPEFYTFSLPTYEGVNQRGN